jgi:hypothetical protein
MQVPAAGELFRQALDKIKDAGVKIKMKPVKWLSLLFAIDGALISSCASSREIATFLPNEAQNGIGNG